MLVGMAKQPLHYEGESLLAGYAARRVKSGFLDDLYVQAVLFKDKRITGFVVFDLLAIDHLIIDSIKAKLKAFDLEDVIFLATHTHSGYARTTDQKGILMYAKKAFTNNQKKSNNSNEFSSDELINLAVELYKINVSQGVPKELAQQQIMNSTPFNLFPLINEFLKWVY